MPVRLKNNARSLLAVSVTATDILIRVRVGKGERFPQLGAGDWFPLALEDDQGNVEITRCVARAGDVLTVQRGQDGTTARAFGAGALVSLRLTATASRAFLAGEDDDGDDWDGDSDPSLTAPRGLIFNGLIVNAYHDETGRQGYFHPYSGTSEGQYVFAGACYQAAKVLADYLVEVGAPDALAVTGAFDAHVAGEAYDGRLQIENAVGACTVRQTGGDTLPAGAIIRVDPWTEEVVVEWPAAAAQPAAELVNPGFEDGDTDGWTTEKIGGVGGAATASTERPQAGTYSGLWTGAKGTGHAKGTECVWTNEAVAPVLQGQAVTANMWFALKDTGSSQNRGRVRIRFRDLDGNLLRVEPGTLIRGNNSSWRLSTANYAAPADGTAEFQAWTTANDSNNSGVLLDTASWTVPENVGSIAAVEYNIELLVTDSDGRSATWAGPIPVEDPEVWATFDPLATGDDITLSNGNKRAHYLTTNDHPGSQSFGNIVIPRPAVNGTYRHAYEAKVVLGGWRTGIGVCTTDESVNIAPTQDGKGEWYCVVSGIPTLYVGNSGMADTGVVFDPAIDVLGVVVEITHSSLDTVSFVLHAYKNGSLVHTTLSHTVDPSENIVLSVGDGSYSYADNEFIVDIETDPDLMEHAYFGGIGWGG